jgi:hypothetical protein
MGEGIRMELRKIFVEVFPSLLVCGERGPG